jgi:hypothetical protein
VAPGGCSRRLQLVPDYRTEFDAALLHSLFGTLDSNRLQFRRECVAVDEPPCEVCDISFGIDANLRTTASID